MIKKDDQISIAAVVPRFGASLGGGAEALVRDLFLTLRDSTNFDLKVLATCASDHRTWENVLPEGESIEEGISINRFPVDERNLETFIKAEQKLQQGFQLSLDEQLGWMENSVNSKALYNFLENHSANYDFIFFAPYLFGTSFWGPFLCPEKSILIPCLHDEAYAYLPIFRNIFRNVLGVMWNAQAEAELAQYIYNIPSLSEKGVVVGMGFDKLEPIEVSSEMHPSPFVLYSGRKETGKNVHYLIECYNEYRSQSSEPLDLVLIGSGSMDFLTELPPGVHDYGFVSELDKRRFLKSAELFIQPSTNESFSIVLMEAWREGTPVLVHSDCAVTSSHVITSDGGWTFKSKKEFISIMNRIKESEEELIKLGNNGKNFVEIEYSRDAIVDRFINGLNTWDKLKNVSGN